MPCSRAGRRSPAGVEPRHQAVGLGLALVVAQHGGEYEFLPAVGVGCPPAFRRARSGCSPSPARRRSGRGASRHRGKRSRVRRAPSLTSRPSADRCPGGCRCAGSRRSRRTRRPRRRCRASPSPISSPALGRGRRLRDEIVQVRHGHGAGCKDPQVPYNRAARRCVGGRDDAGLLQAGLRHSPPPAGERRVLLTYWSCPIASRRLRSC